MSSVFFQSAFPFIFGAVFLFIIGTFIGIAVRGIINAAKNDNSPRVPAQARVVAKRLYTSGGARDTSASTSYYITFEFLSGDRKEFYVPYREYGLIAEGDNGTLTFQGSRFISFERNKPYIKEQ